MKKITKVIIAVVVIAIVCIPIILDAIANRSLKEISYEEYEKVVDDTSRFGFALVYIGKNDEDLKKELKSYINEYKSNDTGANAYYINIEDLESNELESLIGDEEAETAYIYIVNGEEVRIVSKALDIKDVEAYVDEYIVYKGNNLNAIREDLTYYKTLSTAKAYKKLVNDKKTITMAVFGRDTCFYCNQFKPIYNTVAEEYDLNIYYFDSDSYDNDEYSEIMNMGLVVPSSCTESGEEEKLQAGFATPLTLFTKDGKVIDCISGYINKNELITKLHTVGMIK